MNGLFFSKLILSSLMLTLTACASVGVQTRAVLRAPPNVPAQVQITNVPFVEQSKNYCGPSTLAMAMAWAGRPTSVEKLAPEVYTAQKSGTLQLDLISSSRRHGLVAISIDGMPSLLKELAAGHPVIVLENLSLSWFPKWHYAVVIGYDLQKQEFIMHSGNTPSKHVDMSNFERDWKLGDYWGLVVLPAGELAKTAPELDHLQAAVGLEQAAWPGEAAKVYESILMRWPESLAAYIGLGNLAYQEKDYGKSVVYLRQATKLHPDSKIARHNLGVAEKASHVDLN